MKTNNSLPPPTGPVSPGPSGAHMSQAATEPPVLDRADQAKADNAYNALIDTMKHAHLSDNLYNQWLIVGNVENLATYADEFSQLPAERLQAAVGSVLDVAKKFPDSEMGAVLGSAVLSGILQAIEANPEMVDKLGPGLMADLASLAEAIDQSGHIGFQEALQKADSLENWTRSGGTDLADFETSELPGDVDFAKFSDARTASEAFKSVVGDHAAPSPDPVDSVGEAPGGPAGGPMTTDALIDRLMSDPRFAAIIAIIEQGMQQKEAAQGLLNSKSGELDEKTMALYTQANKAADQLIQTATNVQKSNNDIMDTLARNV